MAELSPDDPGLKDELSLFEKQIAELEHTISS